MGNLHFHDSKMDYKTVYLFASYFTSMGCINSTILSVQQSATIQADVGECQSFCKSYTHFGVMAQDGPGAMCNCFNIKDLLTNLQHLIPCSNNDKDNELAFGGASKLSVYTLASKEISKELKKIPFWNVSDYNCIWLYKPPNTYHWTACWKWVKPLCFSNWWQNETLKEFNTSKVWKVATNFCLRRLRYPFLLTYQLSNLDITNTQYWTSNVRAYTISEYKAEGHSLHVKYGYIKRVDTDKYILNFDAEVHNFKSLCNDQNSKVSGSDLNVAVYIAVPVVLVILSSLAIVVLCWWKRKKVRHPKPDIDNSERNPTYAQYDSTTREPKASSSDIGNVDEPTHEDYDIIKEDWESEPARNSVNNHSYFVLEKTQAGKFEVVKSDDYDYAKEVDANERILQNRIYHILEKASHGHQVNKGFGVSRADTDYGHIGDKHGASIIGKDSYQVKGQDDDHVYNKAYDSAATDTYEHINKEAQDDKGPRKENDQGNGGKKYTPHKLKGVALEDKYNHVQAGQGFRVDEEPYNVTSLPKARPANTDNPYDHTS